MNAPNPLAVKEPAPLDELMLAMDVVDTLRHRELMLAREVEADARDRDLLTQLREIYRSQGIAVSDDVLAKGVDALREERFVYAPPAAGVSRALATLYVTRARWGRWVGGTVALVAIAALGFELLVRLPEQHALATLPTDLETAYRTIVADTRDPTALADAERLDGAGKLALEQHEIATARGALTDLQALGARLEQQYELRVVSRPGERSGVYRIPGDNRRARNYYLIVEAVAPNGARLPLPIKSEEDGKVRRVKEWGLRVDEATYAEVAADKRDDGIIERNVVGEKRRGELEPAYSVSTTGAAITKW